MSGLKIPTTTTVNYNSDGTVDIIINYSGKKLPCKDIIPHILSTNIFEFSGRINGINFDEGDLYVLAECYPEWIQLTIDNDGILSIIVYNDDEVGYSVNENEGELNFTTIE